MRRDLRYTLLPEGTSDRALMPILTWTLEQHFLTSAWTVVGSFVQADRLRRGATRNLAEKIRTAVDVYPCEVLFVHRDADDQSIEHRENEITQAVRDARLATSVSPVAVIPVRMSEAWLLIDEGAIRHAAGFRSGRMPLDLPSAREIERRANPKEDLRKAIRAASGQTGRKLKALSLGQARASIAEFIADLAVLRALSSFRRFEEKVAKLARDLK